MSDTVLPIKQNYIIDAIGGVFALLSGEYLLVNRRYPNGGTVVFLRSVHVTLVLFVGALTLMNVLDPQRGREFSLYELRIQTSAHVPWLGAIFVAVYALLYTRFASQWTYLAGMYNQIKAAQVRKDSVSTVLAEWKAAYIEDCDDLHLLRKRMFASTAHEWLKIDAQVRANLDNHAPGGVTRRERIEAEVAEVVTRENRRNHS